MAKNKEKDIQTAEKNIEKEKNYLNLISRIYVIFILAVYPLYVTNEGYNNIVLRKAQIYWIVSIAFIVIFTCFYLVHRLGYGKPESLKKWIGGFGVPDWAAAAFFIIMTLSCVLSKYQNIVWLGHTNRFDGWLTYACMIISYFILSRWYEPKQADAVIFAISSSVVCAIGIFQFYGYDFLRLFPYTQDNQLDSSGNPLYSGFSITYRSTLSNIDFVSAYVCMTVIALGILYVKKQGPLKILYAAASVMNFAFMLIGGADAGKVGLLGAMVLLIPYWITSKKQLGYTFTLVSLWGFCYTLHNWIMTAKIFPAWTKERPRADITFKNNYSYLPLKPVLILSFIALIAGIILILPKPYGWIKLKTAQIIGAGLLLVMLIGGISTVKVIGPKLPESNIIYEASEVLSGNFDDEHGTRRVFIWTRAIKRVPRLPVLGTGTDTFKYAFGEANQVEGEVKHGVRYDKAHNDFIQILLCNGIPGLVCYLAFIGSLLISSIKKAFKDDVLFLALGVAAGYIGQSFFGIDTIIVTPIYWFTLSLLRRGQLTESVYHIR